MTSGPDTMTTVAPGSGNRWGSGGSLLVSMFSKDVAAPAPTDRARSPGAKDGLAPALGATLGSPGKTTGSGLSVPEWDSNTTSPSESNRIRSAQLPDGWSAAAGQLTSRSPCHTRRSLADAVVVHVTSSGSRRRPAGASTIVAFAEPGVRGRQPRKRRPGYSRIAR